MADELKTALGLDTRLVPGGSGVFEVIIDGKLVFSKAETRRFPNQGEITAKLKQ